MKDGKHPWASRSGLKALLMGMALLGTLSGFYLLWLLAAWTEESSAEVSAGIAENGRRAFWYDHDKKELRVIDLPGGSLSPALRVDARHASWSRSGELIHLITHDSMKSRHCFAWVSLSEWKLNEGPFASYFAEGSEEGRVLLFGDGDYLSDRQQSRMRLYTLGDENPGSPRPLFEKASKDGGYSAALVSRDGRFLGVGRWGYNDPSETGVWDLVRWRRIVADGEGAGHFFFGAEGEALYTVRSSKRVVQLHEFDLSTGGRKSSSAPMEGQCSAAEATADLSEIFVARSLASGADHLEVFSTESLSRVDGVSFPKERFIVALRVAEDGQSALALGRTGRLWKWDRRAGSVSEIARARLGNFDGRVFVPILGLLLYGFLWIPSIAMRRRLARDELRGSRSFHWAWLVAAIAFEGLKFLANVADPFFLLSPQNLTLVALHVIVASALFQYVITLLVLRMPVRLWAAVGVAAVLIAGAAFDVYLFITAIAAV